MNQDHKEIHEQQIEIQLEILAQLKRLNDYLMYGKLLSFKPIEQSQPRLSMEEK